MIQGALQLCHNYFVDRGEVDSLFLWGLRPLLRVGTHTMVTSGWSYLDIMDHACMIKHSPCEAYE